MPISRGILTLRQWLVTTMRRQAGTQWLTVDCGRHHETPAAWHSPHDHCSLRHVELSHSHAPARQSSLRCLATALLQQPTLGYTLRAAHHHDNIHKSVKHLIWSNKWRLLLRGRCSSTTRQPNNAQLWRPGYI